MDDGMEKGPQTPKPVETRSWDELDGLQVGEKLLVNTESGRIYTIERRQDGFYISGHPKYCPEPVKASISITNLLIGEGKRMVIQIEGMNDIVYSSRISSAEKQK